VNIDTVNKLADRFSEHRGHRRSYGWLWQLPEIYSQSKVQAQALQHAQQAVLRQATHDNPL
jgi:hypothetical protein